MGIEWTSARARKIKKNSDSLAAQVTADLDKIEEFIVSGIHVSANPEASKARKTKRAKKKLEYSNSTYASFNKAVLDNRKLYSTEKLANNYRIPFETLMPKTYDFGYIFSVYDVLGYDQDGNISFGTDTTGAYSTLTQRASSILNNIDTKKDSDSILAVKGKVVDMLFVYFHPNKDVSGLGNYPQLVGFVGIKTDKVMFESSLKSLNVSRKAAVSLLSDIYQQVINGKPVPAFFTKPCNFDNPVKEGTYVLPGGKLLYFPSVNSDMVAPSVKKAKDAFADAEGEASLPKNTFFFADSETDSLVTIDSSGILTSCNIAGRLKPDNKYKLFLLDKNISFLYDRNQGDLSSYIQMFRDPDAYSFYRSLTNLSDDGYSGRIREVIDTPEMQNFIDAAISFGNRNYGDSNIISWMSYMGILYTLKDLTKSADRIVKEEARKIEQFNACTPDDAPKLPNMREDGIHFPHQSTALAKLDVAKETAIIDIATGGGKAGIIIQDCINLLNKGLINRPIVVMPGALVSQFISEINFFTAGQVNGFALTSATAKKRGLENLLDMAKNAPKNTIFVTTFSFLRKGGASEDLDFEGNEITTFEITSKLKNILGIDYVAVDESQNIKKTGAATFQAVNDLGRGVTYKRIATGTLIGNKPEDVIGQLLFLDPLIIGNESEFYRKYAIGGKRAKGFKSTMAEDLRARLRIASSYIMYREKDWAPLLPTKKYSFTRVELTPEQAKVYKALVSEVMEEIKTDPVLSAAWNSMVEDGAEMDSVPMAILGKMASLEMFLTCPDNSRLMRYANTSSVSVKVKAIDSLIEKSLAMPGPENKVIVAVHYKSSAMHLMQHSKYKDISAYYDASKKDLISQFQNPKSKIKVLFAVIQSIKEGLNLQIANRIIIADVDWTPGNLKQLEARVFRPHVRIKNGEVENLNKGKVVYIDTVIADDSADCLKYAYQSYKKINNAIIMEECPVDLPKFVPLSEETLAAKFSDPVIDGYRLLDTMAQFDKWTQEEIDASLAKGNLKFRAIKHTPGTLGTERAETPWVAGMTLPADDTEEPLFTYLESLGASIDDDAEDEDENEENSSLNLKDYADSLIGIKVRTEYGEGIIARVNKASVVVALKQGGTVTSKPAVVLHKIGSTANKKAVKAIHKIVKDKVTIALAPKSGRSKSDGTPDGSKNPKVIKDYFTSKGLSFKRQRSKDTGDMYCSIFTEDGASLKVKTDAFKDLTLGEWKIFVNKLLEAETGIFDPNTKQKISSPKEELNVKGLREALQEEKAKRTKKEQQLIDKPAKIPVKKEKPKKAKQEEEELTSIPLVVGSYNNIPALLANIDQKSGGILGNLKFEWYASYWSYKVTNASRANTILTMLLDNFRIPKDSLLNIQQCLSEFKKGIFLTAFPEDSVKAFLLKNKRRARQGTLRIYPLVLGDELRLVVDVLTHPGINLSTFKFKKKRGYYAYVASNMSSLRKRYAIVTKKLLSLKLITKAEIKAIKKMAMEHLKIRVE